MDFLRGLRLNCFLAALLPSLLASLLLCYQQYHHYRDNVQTYAKASEDSILYCAELISLGKIDLDNIHSEITTLDERWRQVAVIDIDADGKMKTIAPAQAHINLHDAPPRELVDSLYQVQHWPLSGNMMAVACPLRKKGFIDNNNSTEFPDEHEHLIGVLYGEIYAPSTFDISQLIYIIAAAIFCSLILAMYLSRRIYRPIEFMCNEAHAALNGEPYTGPQKSSSIETAALRSSIGDLLNQYHNQQAQISSLDAASSHKVLMLETSAIEEKEKQSNTDKKNI
ncbi:MAG: hypothetical protein HRU15_19185 [Planctomycetes bacterium]|nr:hypothetical protein [Planctomycetota bacterium]